MQAEFSHTIFTYTLLAMCIVKTQKMFPQTFNKICEVPACES